MMGIMTFLAGLLTLFHPLAARSGGIGALMAIRVIQGLAQVSLSQMTQGVNPGNLCFSMFSEFCS